jgi:hypothetical protein
LSDFFEVVDEAVSCHFEGMVTGESSHEVIYGGEIILLLNAHDSQLVINLSFEGEDSLRSVVEAEALLYQFRVSLDMLAMNYLQLCFVSSEVAHIEQQPR